MRATKRKAGAFLFAFFGMLSAAACTVHKPVTGIQPSVALPPAFSAGSPLPPIDRWWEEFENRELEGLIDEALSENLTLRVAWARLDQARQLARIAGAGRYPGLDFGAGIQQQNAGGDLSPVSPASIGSISASLTASYQVDLWKKIENNRLAAVLDFEAGRQDLEATALTLSANTVELWASIAEQQALLRLLEDQLEVGQKYLKLVESRFGRGISSAVDVYQQRQHVESILEQFPRTRSQQKLLEHQLALLLGKPATAVLPSPEGVLPVIGDLPPTGIPAEVLRGRPDVRAAEIRLFAADRRLAVAVADRFPSISLGAAFGGKSASATGIFNQWFDSLAANLAAPLFDAGRRESEADRNRAVVRERFYQWESLLLNAFTEVEDALSREEGLVETYASNKKQIELARKTLDRSRALYINGLTDYLTVLTSLQSLQSLQRVEISVRKSLVSNRIRLHGALGGSWTARLTEPERTPITETSDQR